MASAYERSQHIREEILQHRRYLHRHAEDGLDLPVTREYVMKTLKAYGLEPELCGYGVTATVGSGGKCILLRADMDALPMAEESGEPFASVTESAHTCGHDLHAAMLLGAAKLLKERESQLKGTVKFMFQPAEETFEGARNMIDNGILENPKVDAALAFHVTAGNIPVGLYMYNGLTAMMASVDVFKVTVHGKGAHGAYPNNAIDPINIGVHVYLAMEALLARETDPSKMCVMTVGKFQAGTAANIIPETCTLEGTIRTNDKTNRALLVRRLQEVAERTAAVYGGTAEVEMTCGVPPLNCDPIVTGQMAQYIKQSGAPELKAYAGVTANASEDFAEIADAVPSAFFHLSAGFADGSMPYPAHNPKVRFHEDVCPLGAALFTTCAENWLEEASRE